MTLRSQLGRVRQHLHCAFFRRPVPLGGQGPIVSFAFDDFPRTALSVGGAILEKFGARGTYYVAAGLEGTTGELGDLFVESDLHALVKKGHEIGSQTFDHSSGRSISIASFEADVRKGVQAVEHLTAGNHINFAYPYGHATLRSKRVLEPCFTSARGIIPGFNGPEIDLNLLRANSLYGGMERAKWAEELIRENVRRKSWLIFYTHDVRPNPSEYGCTPELFSFAVTQAVQSGSRLLTVGQALSQTETKAAVAPRAVTEPASMPGSR